jgi:hypothetical protein
VPHSEKEGSATTSQCVAFDNLNIIYFFKQVVSTIHATAGCRRDSSSTAALYIMIISILILALHKTTCNVMASETPRKCEFLEKHTSYDTLPARIRQVISCGMFIEAGFGG